MFRQSFAGARQPLNSSRQMHLRCLTEPNPFVYKPVISLDEAERILQDALQNPGTARSSSTDHYLVHQVAGSFAATRLSEEECRRTLTSTLSRVRTAQLLQHCSISGSSSNSSTAVRLCMQPAGIAPTADTAGSFPSKMQHSFNLYKQLWELRKAFKECIEQLQEIPVLVGKILLAKDIKARGVACFELLQALLNLHKQYKQVCGLLLNLYKQMRDFAA